MDKQEVIKAFREARVAGEYLLSQNKITWDQFQFSMLSYEITLKEMGVNL
jgi:hypothetical protein